jgi:hypothetical protein
MVWKGGKVEIPNNFLEFYTAVIFGVLSVAVLVWMIKNDSREKRRRIWKRIEELEKDIRRIERSIIIPNTGNCRDRKG